MPRNKLSKFDRELREIISNNLKKYTKHLTQNQFSDMTGIPSSTLSGYFSKRSTPDAGNVQKMADALNVEKSDIDPRFKDGFSFENATKYGINNNYDFLNNCSIKCSDKEKNIIIKYRVLTPEGKATVDAVIDIQHASAIAKMNNNGINFDAPELTIAASGLDENTPLSDENKEVIKRRMDQIKAKRK